MDSRISPRSLAEALGGWRTREPAYEALADGVRLLSLDNRLAPHTGLPAERELARALHVSRTTVASAYRSLRETGHIASLRGSGSVTLPAGRRQERVAPVGADDIDLTQASPAAWPGLAGLFAEVAGESAALVSRSGYDVWGAGELRAAIAARYTRLGRPTDVDQIMITTGAQSAIHLLARTLVARGDRVGIETPTYPHAADAFRSVGARLVSVPVHSSTGWDLDRLVQSFTRLAPPLAYLMPEFQNPTGMSMTPDERRVVASTSAASGTTLLIDDTTADLSLAGIERPIVDFPGADVIRVGSLGKTVWGGLRIGWIRASAPTIRRLVSLRPRADLGTPEFEQAVATQALARMPEVVAQRGELLSQGHSAVVDALAALVPQWRVPRVAGGVSLWVELDAPLSSALVLAARAKGVHLSAGPRFSAEGGHDHYLRIPFTAPPDALRRAVSVLAEAWPQVRAAAPRVEADHDAAVV